MTTALDYYKFATLATASYVHLGADLAPSSGAAIGGKRFAELAADQGRIPSALGQRLFDPQFAVSGEAQWTVLSYYGRDIPAPNAASQDKSGFGATLFARTEDGKTEKVLAMRGTEPDEERVFGLPFTGVDLLSADLGQIGILGLALTQVVSMANYVARLREDSGVFVRQLRVEARTVQPAAAERFVEAAGTPDAPTVYFVLSDAPQLAGLGQQILPGERVRVTGHSLGGHLAYMAARLFPEVFDPQVVVFNSAGYDPSSTNVVGLIDAFTNFAQICKNSLAAEVGPAAQFLATRANQLTDKDRSKVLRLIRQGLYGDFEFAQGAPNVVSLRSEDLASGDDASGVISGLTGADKYGTPIDLPTEHNNHVIEPFMDALALQAAIEPMLSPIFGAGDLVRVLEASAKDRVRSYEGFTEDLYRLLLGKDLVLPDSDESAVPTGKGSISARNSYHDAVLQIKEKIKALPALRIASLADLSADSLRNLAINGDVDAMAYRYALKQLNPFAVFGAATLYQPHNQNGELNRYDPAAGTGAMSAEYLLDRAKFLTWKVQVNTLDAPNVAFSSDSQTWSFEDRAQNYSIQVKPIGATTSPTPSQISRVIFGADVNAIRMLGGINTDRLYGGGGADLLTGGKGSDYLEGGAERDVYNFAAGDGADTLLDTDGKGLLVREGAPLAFGLKQADGVWALAGTTYRKAANGKDLDITFTDTATDKITIKDFDFAKAAQGAYLGIRLADAVSPAQRLTGGVASTAGDFFFRSDVLGDVPFSQSELPNIDPGYSLVTFRLPFALRQLTVEGGAGSDTFLSMEADDAAGGVRYATDDRIFAGTETDLVALSGLAPSGQRGDFLSAGLGRDLVVGAGGNDDLFGGAGADVVLGGPGDDNLLGDANLVWAGSFYTDWQLEATSNPFVRRLNAHAVQNLSSYLYEPETRNDDLLVGGAGRDWIAGELGDDLLLGEAGRDTGPHPIERTPRPNDQGGVTAASG